MTSSTKLPSDVTTLQALLQGSKERNGRKDDRIERLGKLVADFKRALFGSKSETVPTDQNELALEDITVAIAAIHTEDEHDASPLVNPKDPRRTNCGSLPQHLPRVEEGIAPDYIICDCSCERQIIGEDASERLDIVPSQFGVLVTRRPQYACRACENGILQGETLSAIGPRAMVRAQSHT
jgi:transposase